MDHNQQEPMGSLNYIKRYNSVPPFRPIVSSIGTFNYQLASFLGDLVKKVTPSQYSCKDTFTFIEDLRQQNIKGNFMVSFDICSLFTNIPLFDISNYLT